MKLTLGAFIAQLRKEKALTQKQLSEMLSVSDKTVSHWEREESSPDISLLPVIAEIFDITVDELLKGERKEALPEENHTEQKDGTKDTAILYALQSAFNKFRTKSFISIALSVIAVLCGFIVQYFKSIYPGYLVFLTLTVVPVLLTAVFRSGFSSYLASPYIEKDTLKDYKYKANRITANSGYFSFICFAVYSIYVSTFSIPYFANVFIGLLATVGAVLLCETLLKKADAIKTSGKPLKIKKITTLRIISVFIAVILLWVGLISFSSIDKESLIYKNAEYTLLADAIDFIEYMQTPKDAPDKIITGFFHYSPDDKGNEYTFYTEFGLDNTAIEVIDPDYDEEVVFTYNNLEVADYKHTEEGFIVYTHAQLIAAEKEADGQIITLTVLHIVYLIAVVVITFALYKLIKRKLSKSEKPDTITLIKNF